MVGESCPRGSNLATTSATFLSADSSPIGRSCPSPVRQRPDLAPDPCGEFRRWHEAVQLLEVTEGLDRAEQANCLLVEYLFSMLTPLVDRLWANAVQDSPRSHQRRAHLDRQRHTVNSAGVGLPCGQPSLDGLQRHTGDCCRVSQAARQDQRSVRKGVRQCFELAPADGQSLYDSRISSCCRIASRIEN